VTDLAPAGNVEVNGLSYLARSERGKILAGSRVVVTGFDPSCLFVWEVVPEPEKPDPANPSPEPVPTNEKADGEGRRRTKGVAALKKSLAFLLVLPTASCVCGAFLTAHTDHGWLPRILCLIGAAVLGYAANALWTSSAAPPESGVRSRQVPTRLIILLLLLTVYVLVAGVATDNARAARHKKLLTAA
jgi:hypothetical protein